MNPVLSNGISTLFICDALAEVGGTRHILIDPDQEADWKAGGPAARRQRDRRDGRHGRVPGHQEADAVHCHAPQLQADCERSGDADDANTASDRAYCHELSARSGLPRRTNTASPDFRRLSRGRPLSDAKS